MSKKASEGFTLPPQNIEAEECVIASLMIDPAAVFEVRVVLKPEHFYSGFNRAAYEAILSLDEDKEPVDLLTVTSRMPEEYEGVEAKIIGLLSRVPTSVHVRGYAKIVTEAYTRRRLLKFAQETANLAYEFSGENKIDDVLIEVGTEFKNVVEIISVEEQSMSDICQDLLSVVLGETEPPSVFKTDFVDLDNLLEGGYRAGDYVTVAGRPGMGKTSFMLRLAINAATAGKSVGICSYEMNPFDLVARMASMFSGLSSKQITQGVIDNIFSQNNAISALDKANSLPISFVPPGGDRTVASLKAGAMDLYAKGQLDVLMVDYLQLMRGKGERVTMITDISNALKGLALDLGIPVIVLSQLNRGVENRENKRPRLSDLRDSGSIEQDSDIVMFLYRDDYYNPETSDKRNIVEVGVAKHRNGKTGIVDLYWMGDRTDFYNSTRQEINLN